MHGGSESDHSHDELRKAAIDRDLLADERDRIADERDWLADQRERIADERDSIADKREARLNALVLARGFGPSHSPQRVRAAINRSDAKVARDKAKADRDQASSQREAAARQRQALRAGRSEDDTERFRRQVMLQAHKAVQQARMLRGAPRSGDLP